MTRTGTSILIDDRWAQMAVLNEIIVRTFRIYCIVCDHERPEDKKINYTNLKTCLQRKTVATR